MLHEGGRLAGGEDGHALEQERAVEHAPQARAIGGEVGPDLEVGVEGDDGHPVFHAQGIEHLPRAPQHLEEPHHARAVQVFLEEEDDQASAGRQGRARLGRGRGRLRVRRRALVHPRHRLHGNDPAFHLEAEVGGAEAADGAAGAVDDARVHDHALDVHPVAEADVGRILGHCPRGQEHGRAEEPHAGASRT
jgi:hypothetical protein